MNRNDTFPLLTVVKYYVVHHGQVGWNICYFCNEINIFVYKNYKPVSFKRLMKITVTFVLFL